MEVKLTKEKIIELISDYRANKLQLDEKYDEIPIEEAATLLSRYSNEELLYLAAYAALCNPEKRY